MRAWQAMGVQERRMFVFLALFFCMALSDLLLPMLRKPPLPAAYRVEASAEPPGWRVQRLPPARHGVTAAVPGTLAAQGQVPGQVSYLFNQPMNINVANELELSMLPGIGWKLASRIVKDRAANGCYAEVADLDRVSGIGPGIVGRIAPFVTCR